MCGIVGYIGKRNSLPILLEGLHRLEYRGYDSAGVALLDGNSIKTIKTPGKIKDLVKLLGNKKLHSTLGIAHTRWATHGAPNKINAHPHFSCHKNLALVHNGIIENYLTLKKELLKEGHQFNSQTDTEVVVHLIEKYYKNNLMQAFLKALNRLEGSFALALISRDNPQRLLFARLGSPLVLGLGKDENFIASDVAAILSHTNKVVYIKDFQAGEVERDRVRMFNLRGQSQKVKIEKIKWGIESAQKSGFPHFMLKEIHEQSTVLKQLSASGIKFDKKLIKILK